MRTKRGTVAALALAIGASSGVVDAQCPKPTAEIESQARRIAPPATLAQLLDRIDLAAHVRILRAHPHVRRIPGGSTQLIFLLAEVVEPGRAHMPVRSGQWIRIVQRGGVSDDRYTPSCASEPGLTVGRTYLLTLSWNETEDVYYLAFGSDSVFEIENGSVHPRGNGTAARELAGKELQEAIRRME